LITIASLDENVPFRDQFSSRLAIVIK